MKKYYVIPDMSCHKKSAGADESHECITILNVGNTDSEIIFWLYSKDRDPVNYGMRICKAKRSLRVVPTELDLKDENGNPVLKTLTDTEGNTIPKGKSYSMVIESSEPIFVQYTRVTTAQPEYAMFSVVCPEV